MLNPWKGAATQPTVYNIQYNLIRTSLPKSLNLISYDSTSLMAQIIGWIITLQRRQVRINFTVDGLNKKLKRLIVYFLLGNVTFKNKLNNGKIIKNYFFYDLEV